MPEVQFQIVEEAEAQQAQQVAHDNSIAGIMAGIPLAFRPENANRITAKIHFHFTGDEPGDWTVVIEDGQCTVVNEAQPNPNLRIVAPSQIWLRIARRELDAATAFMSGQFTFTGDMGVMIRMHTWFGA